MLSTSTTSLASEILSDNVILVLRRIRWRVQVYLHHTTLIYRNILAFFVCFLALENYHIWINVYLALMHLLYIACYGTLVYWVLRVSSQTFTGYGKMPEYEHIFTDFLLSLVQGKYIKRQVNNCWSCHGHTMQMCCWTNPSVALHIELHVQIPVWFCACSWDSWGGEGFLPAIVSQCLDWYGTFYHVLKFSVTWNLYTVKLLISFQFPAALSQRIPIFSYLSSWFTANTLYHVILINS